jgi:hypothetical protein
MLEIGRDFAQGNESVAFVIGLVVNPGLQVALDMYRGSRRVDPAEGYQRKRGKGPKKRQAEAKPLGQPSNRGSKTGSERRLRNRGLESRVWTFCHITE